MNREKIAAAFKIILEESGADITNDINFEKTPERVAKAFEELLSGYKENPVEILKSAMFPTESTGLVICKDIEYYSMCAHHALGFKGVAHIGYIPTKNVVGLSKMPRIVKTVTRRFQIQERITKEIADALVIALEPKGVMVVVTGKHSCCSSRGIQSQGTEMITSEVRGVFMDNQSARAEFLSLIGK